MVKSSKETMKASAAPDMMPGASSGSVMRLNAFQGVAQRAAVPAEGDALPMRDQRAAVQREDHQDEHRYVEHQQTDDGDRAEARLVPDVNGAGLSHAATSPTRCGRRSRAPPAPRPSG